MRFTLVIFVFISSQLLAQKDSIQEVDEVQVSFSPEVKLNLIEISSRKIQELAPEDVGDVLKKFAGVNLKSYGGLGGLKTVSMRGLGANHTAVVLDGFSLSNNQTGQVNLGQIQAENITNVSSVTGPNSSVLQPISSRIGGSTFTVETFENSFSNKKVNAKVNVKYGSFNQKSSYLGIKVSPQKILISLSGNYRDADGNYPYQYQNGPQTVKETRENNDYQDYQFTSTVGYRGKRTTVRFGYKKMNINQGLPGAVIFYNQTQDERLHTNTDQLFNDVTVFLKRLKLRWYVNALQSKINYSDPTYHNSLGYIDAKYQNRSITGGLSLSYEISEKWSFYGGTEEVLSDLKVNDSLFALPVRFHNYSLLGTSYSLTNFIIQFDLSSQYVSEINRNGEDAQDLFRLNPFLSLKAFLLDKTIMFQGWYRSSFRMPTFNELYYNNIGNPSLKPEDANQFSLEISYRPKFKKLKTVFSLNGFYNQVDHKIVATPTKNLFVWSMQNIGKTEVQGGAFLYDIEWNIFKHWTVRTGGNYTYQKTIDVSDAESPTYKHQVAYVPRHTGNLDIGFSYRSTGLRFSSNFISERYALNENIEANKIKGFYIADISLFHHFKIKKTHSLNVQLNIKNVFNQSYSYIRSFVMPGINYLISLSYAFN